MWRLGMLLLVGLAVSVGAQRRCYSDVDCPENASCDLRKSGRCRCGPNHTSWLDGCQPRRALGDLCQVSPQCRALDEHAVCLEDSKTCGCRPGYANVSRRCQFQFLVTESTLPPEEDAELERILHLSRAGRQRQQELHRQAFVRGLVVTAVLVGLTLAVFTIAWLVSRRVRQREQQEAAALPEKYAAPPPYSVSEHQQGLGGDMTVYPEAGPMA